MRYLCSRVGWMRRVNFRDRLEAMTIVSRQLLGWRHMRVVHPERCPKDCPAVFVSNHLWLNDPMLAWPAVYYSSGERISIHFMMRDDFFRGGLWRWSPFNVDDIAEMCGAIRISRGNVQWSQMKPFLKVLEMPGAFVMFPGGTRSRSGLVFEYREGIDEIGAVSFFVAHAQRRRSAPVPAVPFARTYHPVTGKSSMVFGEALYLSPHADRGAQRAFDVELAVRVANLIEINVPHLVSGILYLRCLHQHGPRLAVDQLTRVTAGLAGGITGWNVDPAARTTTAEEVRAFLRYLERHGMLRVSGNTVEMNSEAILSSPPMNTRYYRLNPVKFQVNQILHFVDVVASLEEAARTF